MMTKPKKRTIKKTKAKSAKKSTPKTKKRAAAKTTAMTAKCPDSERAKIPGIVLVLKDMENPCVLAKMKGVAISKLRATQVMNGASGHLVNTFR